MQSELLLDTREGRALEVASVHLLDAVRPQLLRAIQVSKRLEPPVADSWLGRVNALTRPYDASELAHSFALVAADNLRMVERVLRKELPPFALYSMLRSAVEAASLGLWILDARSEQLAASRCLRIYRQNINSDRTMWMDFVGHADASHDEMATAVQGLHEALRGVDGSHFEKTVKTSHVLARVDALRPKKEGSLTESLSGLEVWRMCSSIVHANPVSMMHLLERHPDGGVGESTTRMSRLSFITTFTTTACGRLSALLDLYAQRSRPRRRGPR